MKFFLFLLLNFLFLSCASNQSSVTEWTNKRPKIYLDENGEKISSNTFQERWRNNKNGLVRWDYGSQDSGRVAKLQKPLYSRHFVTYPLFAHKIEEITGRTFPPTTIFLLEFTFLNDLCSDYSTNEWNKTQIKFRKNFLTPQKEELEKRNENLVILNFFEDGISLLNSPDSPEEYFYIDKDNFLRNNFFKTQTLCGSMAVIKPNGQALVRNGEYSTGEFEQHLKPENWDLFFSPEE